MERRINVLGAIYQANKNSFKLDKPKHYTLFSLSSSISKKIDVKRENIYYNLKRWSKQNTSFNPNHPNSKKIIDAFFEILNVNKDDYIF